MSDRCPPGSDCIICHATAYQVVTTHGLVEVPDLRADWHKNSTPAQLAEGLRELAEYGSDNEDDEVRSLLLNAAFMLGSVAIQRAEWQATKWCRGSQHAVSPLDERTGDRAPCPECGRPTRVHRITGRYARHLPQQEADRG